MCLPLVLILFGIILPFKAAVIVPVMLPLHLLFGLALTSVLKKIRNYIIVLTGIVYVIIVVVLSNLTFLSGTITEFISVAVGTAFFYIWGVRAGIGEISRSFFFYGGGLIIHIISLFIINQINVLKPIFPFAVWVSIIYCIIGLPLANRRFLINETYEKSSLSTIPGSVLRGNRIIVFISLIGIIILSFWRALLDAVIFIAQSISWVILKIVELLGSLYQVTEGGGGGGAPDLGQLPPGEQNPVVNIILNIITVLLFAVILFFVIRYIVKNYKRIYQALYNLISSFFNRFQKWSSTEQGYFDREESLLKTEISKRPSIFKRLFERHPKWRDMKDNESRVRFIYTRFVIDYIRKGLNLRPSDTPSEVVEKVQNYDSENEDHSLLKDVYNSVRYGAKNVDDGTVNTLKNKYL